MIILGFEIKYVGLKGYNKREIKEIYKKSGSILAIKYVMREKNYNIKEAKKVVDNVIKNKGR